MYTYFDGVRDFRRFQGKLLRKTQLKPNDKLLVNLICMQLLQYLANWCSIPFNRKLKLSHRIN